ncbi:DUF2842 domain-containing protein [Aestuariibius sp. 2305UL40-4]|uniref:DUF2842 domain-containing protein n=1 Tax=Aestuariibius violaceus TaxID=3234132 RepID=UPI00345EBDE1
MALSHKAKKRWSLVILVIALPIYMVLAVTLMSWLTGIGMRPPIWLELIIYMGLGILWALPFKHVFLGVGQADPNEEPRQ